MLENIRFKDKKALVQYDLDIDIFNNFTFLVEDIIPVRKVFILITNEGNKILKKIDFTVDDINFINSGLEYIRKNSFHRVFSFVLDKEEKPYFTWNNNTYCVMDLIKARESEYSNPIDIATCSRAIGELHKASEGFKYKSPTRFQCGKIINNFKRKLQELELFKNLAEMNEEKSQFDKIFIDGFEYYKIQILKSIDVMENSSYYKLCSEEDKIVLCHHDLAHHNILIKEEEAYFVDFDYSVIDLKVHDLCNFINKVEKTCSYDIDKTRIALDNYSITNSINKQELEVLYGLLTFPQDIFNIVKAYYTRTKDWDYELFIEKLIKKNRFKEDREEYLNFFKEIYC